MVPCKYDDVILFDDHKYYTELNNKKGIYDSAGKEIFACVYDQILFFEKNHTYFAKLNGKKGVYDSSGKEIIPCSITIPLDVNLDRHIIVCRIINICIP